MQTYRNNLTKWFHARTSTKQRANKHVIGQIWSTCETRRKLSKIKELNKKKVDVEEMEK